MSEVIISARDVTKTYRLYTKPHYRFLDVIGLLRGDGKYSEHHALHRINLNIRRGEKVALIGRNGAGKSTLLKLITGVTLPTSGSLVVRSKASALLQIGTTFHPEFTGRENVLSYLAHLGITGEAAKEKLFEIIEFSELEEYIDQPVKTYSTGMGARLMFSAATAMQPELLVIDEVLSVGDAYFAQKSLERIKEMCEQEQTTLLLVTHDIYVAMKICNRLIWLDGGELLLDGKSVEVANRYEASIRDQQERRLRQKRIKALEINLKESVEPAKVKIFYGQIRCRGTVPVDSGVPVSSIIFWSDGINVAQINCDMKQACANGELVLEDNEGNWGVAELLDDRIVRRFNPDGSIYHRAPFMLTGEDVFDALTGGQFEAEIEFKDIAKEPCVIEIFLPDGITKFIADLGNQGHGEWMNKRVVFQRTTTVDISANGKSRFGNQRFSITDVRFIDREDIEKHTYSVGETLKIKLKYLIRDISFDETPIIQINFVVNGVRSHRLVLDSARFSYREKHSGELEIAIDRITFGPGIYQVNVVAMQESSLLPDANQKFFTANETLLDHHSRAYEILVKQTGNRLVDNCIHLQQSTWYKDGNEIFSGIYWLDTAHAKN